MTAWLSRLWGSVMVLLGRLPMRILVISTAPHGSSVGTVVQLDDGTQCRIVALPDGCTMVLEPTGLLARARWRLRAWWSERRRA